jgi:hypothetical protein
VVNNKIAKPGHLIHGLKERLGQQSGFPKHSEAVRIARGSSKLLIGDNVIAYIHTQFDHHLQGTLDNSLSFPIVAVALEG